MVTTTMKVITISLVIPNIFLLITQVPLPEKPDTEDEEEIKKWKWKVKDAKKENSERHSQRCDIELKLAVRSFMQIVENFNILLSISCLF